MKLFDTDPMEKRVVLSASRMTDMPKYYPLNLIRETEKRREKGTKIIPSPACRFLPISWDRPVSWVFKLLASASWKKASTERWPTGWVNTAGRRKNAIRVACIVMTIQI
ncbi:MAG: hypothetical protein KGY70_18410 [Bacteroidales bacterium]|nr:hypothetical protein [Bacteroidales bacterium]